MELLETLLQALTMDTSFQQEIKIMMQIVEIVPRPSKVPGGMETVTIQTSMVSTMVEHTHPLLMV